MPRRSRIAGISFFIVCALALATAWPRAEGIAQTEAPGAPLSGAAPLEPPPPPVDPPPGSGSGSRPRPPESGPRDRLKVSVLTFSPAGDHPFFVFGHNAIRIKDEGARNPRDRDVVYNYGMFSFEDRALLPKFVLGRFMYWVQADPTAPVVGGYKREGRGVEEQELDFTPDQKLELKRLLEENARPENKKYKYNYYTDNCSTRVRDMIDKVSGGAVQRAAMGPARLTWREHTSRLTAGITWEYVALNLAMGDLIDKPRTEWEESFIPMELQHTLRGVKLVAEDGTERPIVKEERTLVKAVVPMPPTDPPTFWPYMLLAGLIFGGGLAALGRGGVKSRGMRFGYGLAIACLGLVLGFFGWFFILIWAFTDHESGYRNENVLMCVPWAFAFVPIGINVARGRVVSTLRLNTLVTAALATTAFAAVAKVLPWFDQDNFMFLAFFIPFWGGAYYGIRELARKAREAVTAVQGSGKPGAGKPSPARVPAKDATTEADTSLSLRRVIKQKKEKVEQRDSKTTEVDAEGATIEELQEQLESHGGRRTKEVAGLHQRLARAHLASGDRVKALEDLESAFKIDPGAIAVLHDLGVLSLELAEGDPDEKDAHLERAATMFKALLLQRLDDDAPLTKAEIFYYLGVVSHRQGDDEKASSMLERALDNDPQLEKAKALVAELKK